MMFAADSDYDREDTQAYIAYITEGASSNDRRNGSRHQNQENERGTRVGAAGGKNERTAGNRNKKQELERSGRSTVRSTPVQLERTERERERKRRGNQCQGPGTTESADPRET
jgi:hypothetical protein